MKAEINKDGVLQITPETELEQFALEKWSEDYFDPPTSFASLQICRLEPMFRWEIPNEQQPRKTHQTDPGFAFWSRK